MIAFGRKRWEFRSYNCKVRGEIGIAASPNEPLDTLSNELNNVSHLFPRGVLLATGEITSSFFVTAEDLKRNFREPVTVSLHGHAIKTADEPLGEPIEDITRAMNNRGWESFAWLIENVRTLESSIPIEKKPKSTWVTIDLSKKGNNNGKE